MRRERRVVFVLPDLNSGGAERAALNLAGAAPQSRCTVVAERIGGHLMSDPAARAVVFASHDDAPAARVRRVRNLVRVFRAKAPDLVVTMLSPVVPTVAAALCGVPVMQWLQNPWSHTSNARKGVVGAAASRLALRAAAARSALLAGATPGLLDDCASLGVSSRKLAVLPNGLVLPDEPGAPPANADVARVVTVGRLEPQKRHDLLLRAIAELARERRIELTVVGSGRFERSLKDYAGELGISDLVTFTGFVPDPSHHVAASDVFVLATDYEGFGNVIVEALACAVPVVVSDVPYGPRFIAGGLSGAVLVEPGSPAALADGIRTALGARDRAAVRSELRRRAECFTVERVALRFERLVDVALASADGVDDESLRTWP